jgi:hypothetical protein
MCKSSNPTLNITRLPVQRQRISAFYVKLQVISLEIQQEVYTKPVNIKKQSPVISHSHPHYESVNKQWSTQKLFITFCNNEHALMSMSMGFGYISLSSAYPKLKLESWTEDDRSWQSKLRRGAQKVLRCSHTMWNLGLFSAVKGRIESEKAINSYVIWSELSLGL